MQVCVSMCESVFKCTRKCVRRMHVYVHRCVSQCVYLSACGCESVSLAVCLAVLYYKTLNYNWGGNVTACDLILNTSITFSQFKRNRACASVFVCHLRTPIKVNVTARQTHSSIWKCDDLIMAH